MRQRCQNLNRFLQATMTFHNLFGVAKFFAYPIDFLLASYWKPIERRMRRVVRCRCATRRSCIIGDSKFLVWTKIQKVSTGLLQSEFSVWAAPPSLPPTLPAWWIIGRGGVKILAGLSEQLKK